LQVAAGASDDGINVAGGESSTYTGDYYLCINGGTIVVDAAGDGIDVNGAIKMTGGVVLVNGQTEQMNGALDYDRTFNISDGYFVAVGQCGYGPGSRRGFDPELGAGQPERHVARRHAAQHPGRVRVKRPDVRAGE